MVALSTLCVQAVPKAQEPRFRQLLEAHHYLGVAPKMGEPRWYAASLDAEWVALASFSAAALKCRACDQWIGWDMRDTYSRLPGILNHTRFLLLRPILNLGSRVLSLRDKQIIHDWPQCDGHAVMLLETFVDQRFYGGVYRAANWIKVGETSRFRRIRGGDHGVQPRKRVFLQPLRCKIPQRLTAPELDPRLIKSVPQQRLACHSQRDKPLLKYSNAKSITIKLSICNV